MDYSSHQNQHPYPHPSQPYNPQSYYSNYQHPQPQQQYHQPQQQYPSYYSNPCQQQQQQQQQQHPQTHHQQPLIHPPGLSTQPFGYQLPQRPDGVVPVAPLPHQGQSWYPQPQGFRPVIGGPGTYTGPVAYPAPGPSRLPKRAGQSLDRGGGRRGGGQRKGGGRIKSRRDRLMTKNYPEPGPIDSKSSSSAEVGRCELCKCDCGGVDKLKQHESGKRHKRNLKKLAADENFKATARLLKKGGFQGKGGGRGRPIKPAGIGRCEVCKIDTGSVGILAHHLKGKRHKRNLERLEENENKTVSDSQDVQKPSGDLKPGTPMSPDSLLVEEETKQKPPENIPLDTVPSENKLETEQNISYAQQAENQMCGVKRKTLVGGGKKEEVSEAKRLAIGPSDPKVVIPLTCDLCNVKCGTHELLRQHLLGSNHKSQLKCFEGDHPMYGRLGLQALYPPNPVTESLYHSQGAQQVLNGAQVSDPIAGASLLTQNDNAAPSASGVSLN